MSNFSSFNYVLVLLLLIVIILSLGRFLGLPIFISLIASGSMAPSIYPLDIVVFEKKNYSINDIVLWCTSTLFCVAHRVINISEKIIETKGDANPVPDPPVSKNLVRGVAILVIPRIVWIPPVTILVAMYLYRIVKDLIKTQKLLAISLGIITFFSLFSLAYVFLVPINPVLLLKFTLPSMELKSVVLENNKVAMIFTLKDLNISSVDSCLFYYGDFRGVCKAYVNNDSVYAEIPIEIFREMNLLGINRFDISIIASLNRGAKFYSWNYSVYLLIKQLEISVREGVVRIYNPNNFCVDTNITKIYAEEPGPWSEDKINTCIYPNESLEIDLRNHRYAYVKIEYILGGRVVLVQKEVIRDYRPVS